MKIAILVEGKTEVAFREKFRLGGRQDYDKSIHGAKILKNNDLIVAIQACPELKAFVNQIICLCDKSQIIT